jgi:MFS family permease
MVVPITTQGLLSVFDLEYAATSNSPSINSTLQQHSLPNGTRGARASRLRAPDTSQQNTTASDVDPILLVLLPHILQSVSGILLVPIAQIFGRRITFLISGIMSLLSLIWAAQSRSLPSHIGALCVQSLATGALVTIIPLMTQDITFVHERNRALGTLFILKVSKVV